MPTVLVVDDDRLLRESLGEVLSDLGCDGDDASDGDQALKLFAQRTYDLVVSDVDMPDMSGFELLSRLQLQAWQPPLIFLSARADRQLGNAAQSAGASFLFPKPVPLAAFTALVRELLHLPGPNSATNIL